MDCFNGIFEVVQIERVQLAASAPIVVVVEKYFRFFHRNAMIVQDLQTASLNFDLQTEPKSEPEPAVGRAWLGLAWVQLLPNRTRRVMRIKVFAKGFARAVQQLAIRVICICRR